MKPVRTFYTLWLIFCIAFAVPPQTAHASPPNSHSAVPGEAQVALFPVSGKIYDNNAGWPLYAQISVDGWSSGPYWTDPATGLYTVYLQTGIDYTIHAQPLVQGYLPASVHIGMLGGPRTEDIPVSANLVNCNAPGYTVEGSCHPIQGGGMVVGRVADANDNQALVGATVAGSTAGQTASIAAPDPAMGSFYALFQAAGVQTLTASFQNYSNATAPVTVPQSNTIRQDFVLQAGHLTYAPSAINRAIQVTQSITLPVAVQNIGGTSATYELIEVDVSGEPGDVTWLSETPTQVTQDAGESKTINVTLNSLGLDPGSYTAQLKFDHDTPYNVPNLPVTMSVSAPVTYGKLSGTVTTDGYCDSNPMPLPDIPVIVNSAAFSEPITLHTDENGSYQVWLDQSVSPLTVSVNAGADYATGAASGVIVSGQQTTVQDFTLRFLKPCLNATPPSLSVNIPLGTSTTKPLTLVNTGGGSAIFEFSNTATGYTPPTPVSAETPVRTVTIGDNSFTPSPHPSVQSSNSGELYALKVAAGSFSITESDSQAITSGNSVSCSAGGLHADNHYLRVFDLPSFGITDDFGITQVSFGIEQATANGASQPLEVRLYTLEGPFVFANLTPIGSSAVNITNQSLVLYTVPVAGVAPAGAKLVVDIFTPSGQTSGHSFYIGSNNLGETAPSYLAAADCGIPEPVTTAALGFPGFMFVMNVTGTTSASGPAPWLSEVPATGTVSAGGNQGVTVTFDANKVMLPGTYTANATIHSNDPESQAINIATTMVVSAPNNWGILQGTVNGLGHCDAEPSPLAGADLLITGSSGFTRTLLTAPDGSYQLWLPDYASPFTLKATHSTHLEGQAAGLVVTAGGTTTQDLRLRLIRPCVGEMPASLSVTVPWQGSTTELLTLTNTGAAATPFIITEIPGTFTPMAVTGNQLLIVNDGGGSTSAANALATAATNLGYTYDKVSSSSSTGIPADMPAYLAVLYAGVPSTGAEHDQLIAYLDSGGHLLIADNDFGYSDKATVLYQTYLEATYVADSGSDGPIHGVDIEAGTDVDISSDPYPDSFTIGPDAVGIFANTAPRVNWAGMRIARNAYKAVYLAWDYYYAGGSAVGDAVETEILGKILPWLTTIDVKWVAEVPDQGNLAANSGSQSVQVAFKSNVPEVTQPGTYSAQLKLRTDDPVNPQILVPVTMVVNPSPTYAKVWGTVRTLGLCDTAPVPLEGAQVDITIGTNTYTITTGVDGYYQYWMNTSSPTGAYHVTATGYLGEDRATFFYPGADPRNQQDFDLHWLQPCGALTPASLSAKLTMGTSTALSAQVANSGWDSLHFTLRGRNTGFIPMDAAAAADILLVDNNNTSANTIGASLARLGYSYDRVTTSSLPPNESWRNYQSVIWAGSPGGSTNLSRIKSYLDNRGRLLITYNDLGYFYYSDTFYTQYLEASYLADAGSDGPVTGSDIMAGLNLDISADPYPDSFSISGPNAVPIFINTTPRKDYAGLRIEKDGYKAIYFAWNFPYTGTSDAEKDTALGKALAWLMPGATWIKPDPTSGIVADHSKTEVKVTLDAADASIDQPGTYQGELLLVGNTPGQAPAGVPVTMQVDPPASWGKLEGIVNSLGHCDADPHPLTGIQVSLTNDVAETVTLVTDASGHYSRWLPEGKYTIMVEPLEHQSGTADVEIVSGSVTTQNYNLRWLQPCSVTNPSDFDVNLRLGTKLDKLLTIHNNGGASTDFLLQILPVLPGSAVPIVGTTSSGKPHGKAVLSLSKAKTSTIANATQLWAASGPVSFVVDDGSLEYSVGLNSDSKSYQFIWMNRFTPALSEFPLMLDQISILWPSEQVTVGNNVELVVYQDTDGDGDPSNAELVGTYSVTAHHADGLTWDDFSLPEPLLLMGPGDVLIGAINRWVNSGSTPAQSPASIDLTASQGRSWVGWWATDPPTPPVLPLNDTFATIDSLGISGNWMVRGSGHTAEGLITWLTIDATTGTLDIGGSSDVTLHFDANAISKPGVYEAKIRYFSSDPVNPFIMLPVKMTVTGPGSSIYIPLVMR